MIYEAMKWLVEWLVWSYKCECGSGITEWSIDVLWAAWESVNFDIMCPKCGKHWFIKSHLIMVDWNNVQLQNTIETLKTKLTAGTETFNISDKEITDLSKDLKSKQINVSDLFN